MSVLHALLALLSEGPKYGLWLREEFEARTGEVWPLNVGQVFGALDSVNAEDVMDLLRQACQRGVAAIVVTPDAQLASWADRVMLLRDGRITGQTTQPPGPQSLLTPGQGR
jgi:putative ABC transport system ATP-binding protein